MKIERIAQGPYGLLAVARIPPIAEGKGSLLDFKIKVKRLFKYRAAQESYAMARCFDERLNARMGFDFVNGEKFSGLVSRACTATG